MKSGPLELIMGRWNVNRGPWNVYMGQCNVITESWNVNRVPGI